MSNGGVITKNGCDLLFRRAYGTSETALSRFRIGTGTTTPTESDTALATALSAWATGGGDYKNFMTGYPTYDDVNKKVVIRGLVNSAEANGNTLTEVGEFNTDGTPVMGSRDVYTAIVKSSSVSVIYEWIHEFI